MLGTDTRALQVLDRSSPLSHTLALPILCFHRNPAITLGSRWPIALPHKSMCSPWKLGIAVQGRIRWWKAVLTMFPRSEA